jgi:hypothetical protein
MAVAAEAFERFEAVVVGVAEVVAVCAAPDAAVFADGVAV